MTQEDISRKWDAENQDPGFDPHPTPETSQALLFHGPSCARLSACRSPKYSSTKLAMRGEEANDIVVRRLSVQNFSSVVLPNKAWEKELIIVSLGKLT